MSGEVASMNTQEKSTENTKVLFVFDNMELSGAEKVALNLIRHCAALAELNARGAICMDDKLAGSWKDSRIEHLGAGEPLGGSLAGRILRGVRLLPRLVKLCSWADIVVPVTPPAALWAAVAGVCAGKPVAPWVHYDLNGLAREGLGQGRKVRDWLMLSLYRRFIPKFSQLVFVSDQAKESFLTRSVDSLADKDWIVLPNVYDRMGFSKEPSKTGARMLALKVEGKPLLLVLGRVFRQKRWEDAVMTAEILHKRGRAFNLAFVGDGVELGQLERRVAASPAKNSIHLLGADPNPMPALALADALIMTSLYEAWPTVILEAFDVGVPVFAYDCPSGPAEMLGHCQERGFLTRECPYEMAEALEEWHWGTPQMDKYRRWVLMKRAAHDFLNGHRPELAVRAWSEGLSRLAGR